jgi:hypothetical protein
MAHPADILAGLGFVTRPYTGCAPPQHAAPLIGLAAIYSVFAGAMAFALYRFRGPLGGPTAGVFLFFWPQVSALLGAVALTAVTPSLASRFAVVAVFLVSVRFPRLPVLRLSRPQQSRCWFLLRQCGRA